MDKNQQCECGGRLMKYGFRQLKSGRYQQFRCVECKKFVVSGVSQHAKELIKKLPKVGPQGGMVPAIVDAKQNIHAEGFNGMGCSARVTSFGARIRADAVHINDPQQIKAHPLIHAAVLEDGATRQMQLMAARKGKRLLRARQRLAERDTRALIKLYRQEYGRYPSVDGIAVGW